MPFTETCVVGATSLLLFDELQIFCLVRIFSDDPIPLQPIPPVADPPYIPGTFVLTCISRQVSDQVILSYLCP